VTIVQLSELDEFLKDSLSIVRRGVANARNANQSNPMQGIMADLPEKVDFEIMVVSSSQLLNRQISTLSNDTGIERYNMVELNGDQDMELNTSRDIQIDHSNETEFESRIETSESSDFNTLFKSGGESSSTREVNNDISGDASIEFAGDSSAENEDSRSSKLEAINELSKDNNNKTSTSVRSSNESAADINNGTSNSIETDKTDGVGLNNATDIENKNSSQTAKTNSTDKKIEKNNTSQNGSTAEWNTHAVKGFDQSTGRWGGQSFAPVNPPTQTLKCS
jgi:hypothetical protein